MYLLMLLATFISAIYGFNLSARPDYDRDVPKKKAMAVIYKFLYQDKNAVELAMRINIEKYKDTSYALAWVLPRDRVYADFNNSKVEKGKNEDTTLFYEQPLDSGAAPQPFYLRKQLPKNSDDIADGKYALSENYLEVGHRLYDGTEMVTKILCLDREMYEAEATNCTPTAMENTEGTVIGFTDTCCNQGRNYAISYKKLDSRWVNRIHKGISLDFMNAIVDRDYTDNIGVISWDPEITPRAGCGDDNGIKGRWVFRGKINFYPVFAEEEMEWEAEHSEEGKKAFYPGELKNRATWIMPISVFPENFFTNKDGEPICELGCLVKIRMF